jgi:hypothetical protein
MQIKVEEVDAIEKGWNYQEEVFLQWSDQHHSLDIP